MTTGEATGPLGLSVRAGGDPTDEEMAAIVAAASATLLVPRPGAGPSTSGMPRWRFSGRWWVKPVPLRRRRPW